MDGLVAYDACVVDEDFNGAEVFFDLFDAVQAGFGVADIPFIGGNARALRKGGGFIAVLIIIDGDVVSPVFEKPGGNRADARGAPGNQNNALHGVSFHFCYP